jgi:hypothetical protein
VSGQTTVPCQWTFGGKTYETDSPVRAVIDGEGRASMDDHGVAERAAVYAAMCDGIDDPETLSFARRSIGLGKVAMAARFGLPVEAFMDIENNRGNTARVSYVYLLRGWVKKSDRGTFAVRRAG